ncbi:peroxiredoxin [Sphingorhabdus lutea]|uniref:Alkyl hydroperoxide reductase C n=1 Tax=Sphingorhabdus lutea TaxID=1913578 RepID=A0A1L3J8W1_9SPHN|nr:peroxiredoxin [Sphingorhabdus lutea]APG61554.1 peroxiredoxin [Sphingorhabdus lutea]
MSDNMQQPPATLRIGDIAPDFQARSTHGPIRLSDYRGKWLIFFSHPADFTPVCTTEFVTLAQKSAQFSALDCGLIGLSVDSLYSHFAWVRAIEGKFGIKIPFPIIEDPNMAIGRAYNMVDEHSIDSSAMRTCYFIDPKGVIRATTNYPHDVGRSVDEMLRIIAALQITETQNMLTPEGWRPGDKLLQKTPLLSDEISADDDWFCQKVDIK